VIKYIGSKRILVPVLGTLAEASGARTAVDLFTGTTRVAQEFKRRGLTVTAADIATYSEILAQCYITTDAGMVAPDRLRAALAELESLDPVRGYVTETFCENARYFRPENGSRIDAMREHIEAAHVGTDLYPVLLTALMLAADRVDSTTGLQQAFLKSWAPRSLRPLQLRAPELLPGTGAAVRGDAAELARTLPRTDLMYVDPPYNQHRYFTNYHVWETLIRWDAPEHYGVACKRIDARDEVTKSRFNVKRTMPEAFRELVLDLNAETVLVSYNDESWVTAEQIAGWLREAGHQEVQMLAFDAKRYVGARIGVYSPAGQRVGTVGRLTNTEYVLVAGARERVEQMLAAVDEARERVACP
jgi:adenine-specific DNA-methyltransferase